MLVTVMDMKEEVGVIDVYVVSLLNRKAKKKKITVNKPIFSVGRSILLLGSKVEGGLA